jgi:hypothetical protein
MSETDRPDAGETESVLASSLRGNYSRRLPPKARIIRANTDMGDSEHPADIAAGKARDSLEKGAKSRRRANSVRTSEHEQVRRNHRAAWVTPTFRQPSGRPRVPAEVRTSFLEGAATRVCSMCGLERPIAAFPDVGEDACQPTRCARCIATLGEGG